LAKKRGLKLEILPHSALDAAKASRQIFRKKNHKQKFEKVKTTTIFGKKKIDLKEFVKKKKRKKKLAAKKRANNDHKRQKIKKKKRFVVSQIARTNCYD
jgi:hypothetical protein